MGPALAMTKDGYLARTESWELRHEWVNGEARPVEVGTRRHAAVAMNVCAALMGPLRGTGCRAFNSLQQIHVPATDAYLFADGGVVCGPFEHPEGDRSSVTNPVVLVEVLSPSTRDYDQGARFDHYRRLVSLQHYVLVDPDEPHVIHHRRQDRGWFRTDHEHGAVELDGAGIVLVLDEVYEKLEQVE